MIEVSVAPDADSEHRASTSVDAQKKALFSFLAKKPPRKNEKLRALAEAQDNYERQSTADRFQQQQLTQ